MQEGMGKLIALQDSLLQVGLMMVDLELEKWKKMSWLVMEHRI